MTRFFTVFFFLGALLAAETDQFRLYAWGLPVATVNLTTREDSLTPSCVDIQYRVRTSGIIRALYPVDNQYDFTVDSGSGAVLVYRKDIRQFNLSQRYSETWNKGMIHYNTGDSIACPDAVTHPLVLILRNLVPACPRVHIEGEFYDASFLPCPALEDESGTGTALKLTKKSGEQILPMTDIFTWKIADPEAEKCIRYGTDGRINRAYFRFGTFSIEARPVLGPDR